jgi:spore maturation protein CgeB
MGRSGTLMLCQNSPHLDDYYKPGEEYIAFESLEDCVEKARFYLANESARKRIASRYRDRTIREHLWEHRFNRLFSDLRLVAPVH